MQKTAAGRTIARATAWLLIACVRGATAGALQSPGCLAGGEPATVAAVDTALNLRLSDGRVVRVAGLHTDPADRIGPAEAPQTGLASWLEGASVRVAPLRGEPDRWGRQVALVFAPARSGAAAPVSVGEAALEAGLATAEPEPGLEACWPIYLQLEDAARRGRVGLWASSDTVIDPGDRPALARRLGLWTLVEGRVAAVREGRARAYVRFGRDGGPGMAVAIDHATLRRLVRTFGATDGWTGRPLLARGLLDDRWGLQIDVSSSEQISLGPP